MTGPIKSRILETWIRQISSGDRAALEKLYRCVSPSIYGYALSILQNSQDAQDVLQDCILSIWKSASTYTSFGKPLAWVLMITKNLCLKRLRERQRFSSDTHFPVNTLPNSDLLSENERILLRGCLEKLSDQERKIVILHAVVGYKHREIADHLQLPLSTVLSKYRRALKKLKEMI